MGLRCCLCLELVSIRPHTDTAYMFEHLPVSSARDVRASPLQKKFYESRLSVLEPILSLLAAHPHLRCATHISTCIEDFEVYHDEGSTSST